MTMRQTLVRALQRALLASGLLGALVAYGASHQMPDLSQQPNLGRPDAVGSLPWYEAHGYECWTSGSHPYPTHVYEDGQMRGQPAVDQAVDAIFNQHRALNVTFCAERNAS